MLRGLQVEVPYPAGRKAQDYQRGGAQIHAPGLARHLIEANDTFTLQYGVEAITLKYLSDLPMPAGTRYDLRTRLLAQEQAMALPEGEVAASFMGCVQAVAPVVAIDTPYKAGGYEGLNPLPPTSVARLVETDGRSSRDFGVDPALLAAAAGIVRQDTHDPHHQPNAQGLMTAAIGATSGLQARNRILPTQEVRDLRHYDMSRIQAEIAELTDRYRAHGYQVKPQEESGLPMQEIKDAHGNILMRGRAASVEHLIAIKMREAELSNDPNKKIVSLAGAQLDERTLGRPLQLEGFEFKNVDMRGANLTGAQIKDCGFENCDMEGVCLKKATINLCSFQNVNLNEFVGDSKTKFENCALQNVHMQGAEAPGVKFENIRAEKLNIKDANFNGSSWTHVHIENLYGPNAKMNGAKLGDFHVTGRESNMDGWKLNQATVHNASFGTAEYGIPMRGMEAQNSHWSDVQFNKSDLSKADFTKATFTRVDMRNVVTPRGPMEMREANLTGLTAGQEAKFTAYKATHSGITMFPHEDFVFRGTAPIERAAKAAISVRSDIANIVSADGATKEEQEARNTVQMQQQMAMVKKRQQMAMAPSPYHKSKNKDTPWG